MTHPLVESATAQPRAQEGAPLNVVVLSCSDLGIEVARTLHGLPAVRSVALITAPYPSKPLKWRIRHVYRTQGPWRLVALATRNLLGRVWRPGQPAAALLDGTSALPPSIHYFHFEAFHDPECLRTLAALEPDLGIVAGTYILTENVFGVPRLGSINLHSGKAPEYRGAAPAFWELYNGETEVGITIHRVTRSLDAGSILLQESFPLDPAPEQDPL
ncbi:MAG TPA: formyltransferase family protein, partial [Longimicrobiaceae bacterium]|nr:formyltransferase family protein [Longimicrobiaceae bacterium]